MATMNHMPHQAYPSLEIVRPGADRTGMYLSKLEGKKIGIVANHTSLAGKKHLVDKLVAPGRELFKIRKLFGPEHGFRGQGEDAVPIEDEKDHKTGIPIISLYGHKRKPDAEDLSDLDLLLFDIQDVGVRFYTYISTLFYVMQACAERDMELFLLDRPNPNGSYVDGPVLEPEFSSFDGFARGTRGLWDDIGEYARMVNGEGWLGAGLNCKLTVIPCEELYPSKQV